MEVIVSAGIMTVLTGVTLVGLFSARRSSAARQAAEQFAGFLRETATLTLSGVRGATCDPTSATPRPECFRYTVASTANSGAYTRQTVALTDSVPRSLPGGVRFGSAVSVTFTAVPPTLRVTPNPATFLLSHPRGSPVWRVCLTGLGRVTVTAAPSC